MSVRHELRRVADRLLRPVGFRLERTGGVERASLDTALRRLARLGVEPRTVVDVGAAYGDWTLACSQVFPAARYLLIEPLREYAPFVERALAQVGDARLVPAVAAAADGQATLYVHADLVGSSLYREREEGLELEARTIDAVSVDSVVRSAGAQAPYLLKIDVQGAELAVLQGAGRTLREAVAVLCEVSFLDFFEGGVRVDELVGSLAAAGFVPYDLFGIAYRPLDGALAQADILFVPHDSPLRADAAYARPAERALQNEQFRVDHGRRLAALRRP